MIVALVTSHLKISLEGRVVTGAISSAEKSARKKFSKELYFRTVQSRDKIPARLDLHCHCCYLYECDLVRQGKHTKNCVHSVQGFVIRLR
jgi:hypothetical protein